MKTTQTKLFLIILLLSTITLTGCLRFPWEESNYSRPATTKFIPPTRYIPTTPTPEDSSADPSPVENGTTFNIYLIALENPDAANSQEGKTIGCNDTVVAVERSAEKNLITTEEKLNAAFTELLGLKEKEYGESGLQNFLADSDLQLENIKLENGLATINLTGQISLAGICDNPRFEAQLIETAKQFPDVKDVQIFINGKALQDLMSMKG